MHDVTKEFLNNRVIQPIQFIKGRKEKCLSSFKIKINKETHQDQANKSKLEGECGNLHQVIFK
jgi:hypothetical protein